MFFISLYSKNLFILKQIGGYQSAVASILQAEIQNAVVLCLRSLHLDHNTFVFPESRHFWCYSWTVL